MSLESQHPETESVSDAAQHTRDHMQTTPSTSSVLTPQVKECGMPDLEEIETEAPPVALTVLPASSGFHKPSLQVPKPPRVLRRMDTMQLVELGSRSLFGKRDRTREFSQNCEVIEEQPQAVELHGEFSEQNSLFL